MDTPYGPHKITGNRQVAIPKELADLLKLQIGDKIYFMVDAAQPGTLTIVPVELMAQWIAAGRHHTAYDDQESRP